MSLRSCLAVVLVGLITIAAPWGWPVAVLLAVSASDAFTRADADDLGTDWTTQSGVSMDILNNEADGDSAGAVAREVYAAATTDFPDDHCSTVTLRSTPSASELPGVSVRAAEGATTSYEFYTSGTDGTWREVVNNTINQTQAVTMTSADGDRISMCASGTTMSLYKNGGFLTSFTDATITTGQPGIFTFGTGVQIDDWLGTETLGGCSAASLRGFVGC